MTEAGAAAPRDIDIETIGEDVPLLEGLRTTCATRRLPAASPSAHAGE